MGQYICLDGCGAFDAHAAVDHSYDTGHELKLLREPTVGQDVRELALQQLEEQFAPADEPQLIGLCGRYNAGLGVQLLWNPANGDTFITTTLDGEYRTVLVPPEKALDAFDHPALYGGL